MNDKSSKRWIAETVLVPMDSLEPEFVFKVSEPYMDDGGFWTCDFEYHGPGADGGESRHHEDSLGALISAISGIRRTIDSEFSGALVARDCPHSHIPLFVPFIVAGDYSNELEQWVLNESHQRSVQGLRREAEAEGEDDEVPGEAFEGGTVED